MDRARQHLPPVMLVLRPGLLQVALNIPDELSLDHIWKDKKREYSFDAVFAPGATQEKARPKLYRRITCFWPHCIAPLREL